MLVAMDEETKWVPCLIRMVRFCQLTCDVQMCLGSGYHFALWIRYTAYSGNDRVLHPRIGGAHLDQDSANHGRIQLLPPQRRGRVRGGGGFRVTHQVVRARWSFFDYSQESRSPRARDRQTAAPSNYYLLAQSVRTEFDPTRIPQEWTARSILGELIWRRAQNSQITTAPISKFGRASLCPGESASTLAPSKPARLAHCV